MDVARRTLMPVRWRMAPQGVAADAYLVHKHSIVPLDESPHSTSSRWGQSGRASGSSGSGSGSGSGNSSINSTGYPSHRKLTLDHHGWHRGRPVCILGHNVDVSTVPDEELAPLPFPDALQELQNGLQALLNELIGLRMLYTVGHLAWTERMRWHTHRLHVIHQGKLIAVIEPEHWCFHLLNGCGIERMEQAHVTPMPRSGKFHAEGFQTFALETALWEFAKRCPEAMLQQILPDRYLKEPLTHRRMPHLKEHALGDHCVAILRALDTRSRTADELETSLRMKRPSLMRALTCLALVRAIKPELQHGGWGGQLSGWWAKLTGKGRKTAQSVW
jgi:hypothetical protein